jgi:hypothetical protein
MQKQQEEMNMGIVGEDQEIDIPEIIQVLYNCADFIHASVIYSFFYPTHYLQHVQQQYTNPNLDPPNVVDSMVYRMQVEVCIFVYTVLLQLVP